MGKPILERLKIAERRIVELYKRPTTSGGGDTNPTNPSFTSAEVATGGTWIDGKPIYRKVIPFTAPPLNSPAPLSIFHNLSIDKYLKLDVVTDRPVENTTEDQLWSFPLVGSSVQVALGIGVINAGKNTIAFNEISSTITTNDFLLILEYTKA